MGIPTEPVGSLPRPQYLQAVFADYDSGTSSLDDLLAAQDKAAADSVRLMEETGQELVTDGEQRVCIMAIHIDYPGTLMSISSGLFIRNVPHHRHAGGQGAGRQSHG